MLYLKLFLTFLEIGAVSFGGGYGMISLIREKVIAYGWLSESDFLSFIAVSESTPGPLAVNMATFIGSSQGGIGGALAASRRGSSVLHRDNNNCRTYKQPAKIRRCARFSFRRAPVHNSVDRRYGNYNVSVLFYRL